jgi:5'-phosphate synthase pdxT subunit
MAVLKAAGAEPTEVRRPCDVEGLEALVLPGGESTTLSLLLASSGLDREIERMVSDRVPMLGTCAGMILLAREVTGGRPDQISFGAIDIAVRRNGYGRQVESFETDLDVKGLDEPMHAVFIRAPVVEQVGDDVDVLAEVRPTAETAATPVVCSSGPVLVASFHPELAGESRLHELLLATVEGG